MEKLEAQIQEQIIGQKILTVTYFEVNHTDQEFFHTTFDTFDLGITIEMSNGFQWYIGWTSLENHEIGIGPYQPPDFIDNVEKIDATFRWLEHGYAHVKKFELIYVNEEWKIPAKCTITFDNKDQITLLLAEELNLDKSLLIPLKFSEHAEIYVFYGFNLPELELVQIELPSRKKYEELFQNDNDSALLEERGKTEKKVTNRSLVGVLILFIIVVIIIVREHLK